MEQMPIGRLAKMAGVNVETVRYYERRGLMPPPRRRASGYRHYSRRDLERMLFIRRAKELGFTLKEIGELLGLRVEPGTTCRDVREVVGRKLEDIEEKVRDLHRLKAALKQLADRCTGDGPTSECPILDALESPTDRNPADAGA
ncbi:MAG TPA: MerR family transcriptional regulator [Bacteroidetes bacterium]|nr:MerR family transcriptional regulator [Bacteroidota bacterium]